MLYIVVVLAIGVSTNIEGLTKSVIDQRSLNLFNQLNTAWLVVYFCLLQYLQSTLLGVFTGYLMFYTMRFIIAAYLLLTAHDDFRSASSISRLLPRLYEIAAFAVGYYCSRLLMLHFDGKPTLGFMMCTLLTIVHLAVFAYLRKSDLLYIRAILTKTKHN